MLKEEFKSLTHMEQIRVLSGVLQLSGDDKEDVKMLTTTMALICLITRVASGDADAEFLDSVLDKVFADEEAEEEE